MLTHRFATILGDIPRDWNRSQVTSLLASQQAGDWGDDSGEAAVKVLRSTNFTSMGEIDLRDVAIRLFPQAKADAMELLQHDILLERSGGGPTQPVGRVGFVRKPLPATWFSNFVQLLRPDGATICPDYLAWVLFELHRSGVIERLQHQTTQMRNLDYRDYLRAYLPDPRPSEQKTIAEILNIASYALSAAETKLASARRLKTALMQQLFTAGIPGHHRDYREIVIFRTRINVPATWEVASLTHSVRKVEYGTNAPSNPVGRGYPVVAIPEVIAPRFRLGNCSYAEVPDEEANALRLLPDDVLLIRTNGNSEYIGKSTVIGEEARERHIIYASYLIRVQTRPDRLSGRYLNYFLASPVGRRQCIATANTSAGNHNLGSRSIRHFTLPRPEPDEQAEIVGLIDAAEDSIEAIGDELRALSRLKTSLLQNLLTGKVRVKMEAVA